MRLRSDSIFWCTAISRMVPDCLPPHQLEVLIGTIAKKFYGLDMLTMEEREDRPVFGESLQWCELRQFRSCPWGRRIMRSIWTPATLEYEYAPLGTGDARIVIACSKTRNRIGGWLSNTRRSECDGAAGASAGGEGGYTGRSERRGVRAGSTRTRSRIRCVCAEPVMRSMRIEEPARRQALKKGDLAELDA